AAPARRSVPRSATPVRRPGGTPRPAVEAGPIGAGGHGQRQVRGLAALSAMPPPGAGPPWTGWWSPARRSRGVAPPAEIGRHQPPERAPAVGERRRRAPGYAPRLPSVGVMSTVTTTGDCQLSDSMI